MSDYTTRTGYAAGASTTNTSYNVVSAVFDDASDAQRAVDELRSLQIPESAISIVARRGNDYDVSGDLSHDTDEAADEATDTGKGALTGAGIGAAVGALFGLAAFAIPGAGPFIAAGTLASALGSGVVVGGASGALAGALTHWGMNDREAHYYAGEVERGGTYVGVDLSQMGLAMDRSQVVDILRRCNGRIYSS